MSEAFQDLIPVPSENDPGDSPLDRGNDIW